MRVRVYGVNTNVGLLHMINIDMVIFNHLLAGTSISRFFSMWLRRDGRTSSEGPCRLEGVCACQRARPGHMGRRATPGGLAPPTGVLVGVLTSPIGGYPARFAL